MERRNFIKAGGALAALSGLGIGTAHGFIPAHNWDKYDFGSGPVVNDRLYQGPFPQYSLEPVVPGSEVVMTTTPSKEIVPNYGMGLTVYISGDLGPPRLAGETLEKSIEDLVKLPFVQKMYIRPNWREMQNRPGRLDLPDYWKIIFDLSKSYDKRICTRIMLENPDGPELGMPDFLMDKVPYVKLRGEWNRANRKDFHMPRYDNPAYQAAFRELVALLAEELNGNPQVEYMDTFMYGFWGEGHTWPFQGNPFPDNMTAERTFMKMFETQLEFFTKTPLVTNTQPDFSMVGNSELVDRTIRTHNWLRTDSIFIENEQIETLSNRPPWIATISETGLTTGESSEQLQIEEGITKNENIMAHVIDTGANYWSVWNFHHISAKNVLSFYEKHSDSVDDIARRIGYRVRPSWIWYFEKEEHPGLILGLVNDGIAGVPGVLRITVLSDDGKVNVSGCLVPGYPLPSGVRQAMILLPKGTDWKGLKLKAELEVKGVLHPVRWACHQQTNKDGTLTLRSMKGM